MVRWGGGTRRSGKSAVEDMIFFGGGCLCGGGGGSGGLKGLVVAVARCVWRVAGHGGSLGKPACPSATWTGNISSTSEWQCRNPNTQLLTRDGRTWIHVSPDPKHSIRIHTVNMGGRNNGLGDPEQYQGLRNIKQNIQYNFASDSL